MANRVIGREAINLSYIYINLVVFSVKNSNKLLTVNCCLTVFVVMAIVTETDTHCVALLEVFLLSHVCAWCVHLYPDSKHHSLIVFSCACIHRTAWTAAFTSPSLLYKLYVLQMSIHLLHYSMSTYRFFAIIYLLALFPMLSKILKKCNLDYCFGPCWACCRLFHCNFNLSTYWKC